MIKAIEIIGVVIGAVATTIWLFYGYDILFKAIVILLLWMIFVQTQYILSEK